MGFAVFDSPQASPVAAENRIDRVLILARAQGWLLLLVALAGCGDLPVSISEDSLCKDYRDAYTLAKSEFASIKERQTDLRQLIEQGKDKNEWRWTTSRTFFNQTSCYIVKPRDDSRLAYMACYRFFDDDFVLDKYFQSFAKATSNCIKKGGEKRVRTQLSFWLSDEENQRRVQIDIYIRYVFDGSPDSQLIVQLTPYEGRQ